MTQNSRVQMLRISREQANAHTVRPKAVVELRLEERLTLEVVPNHFEERQQDVESRTIVLAVVATGWCVPYLIWACEGGDSLNLHAKLTFAGCLWCSLRGICRTAGYFTRVRPEWA